MFKQMLFATILAVVAVSSSGCATMVASKTSPYNIVSAVPGAEVRINGMPVGRTPTTVDIDRKHPQRIEVSMPGYYPQTCWPHTSVGVVYALVDTAICLAAFPLGCISFIDASGAWNSVDDEVCNVNLQPAVPQQPIAAPQPTYAPATAQAVYPPPPPPPQNVVY